MHGDAYFFSRRDEGVIGSFHHGLGLVEINWSLEAIDLFTHPEKIADYASDHQKLLSLLLEMTSFIHERVHLLDTFGTVGGLSLYTARLACAKQFLDVALELKRAGMRWQLPLSTWAKQADCPASVRRLLRIARSFRVGSDAFLAPFSPFGVPEITLEPWLTIPFHPPGDKQRIDIPAFPKSIGLKSSDGNVRPVSIVFPVGYEAVVEGVAHSVARSFIDARFSSIAPELMTSYGPPKQFIPDPDHAKYLQQVAASQEIYNVTDFMISKYLRTHGIDQFPRELVLKLSDIALSGSMIQLDNSEHENTKLSWRSPGSEMIGSLERTDISTPTDPAIEYPDFLDAGYATFLSELKKGGDWHTVENKDSFLQAIRVWESFVAQNVTVPLFEKRLESRHACFYTAEGLLELAFSANLPMVQVINGQLDFEGIPDEVRNAWGIQMFLGEITHQVFADSRTILCPRRHRLVPGMESADFSGGHCPKHERLGCGSWVSGEDKYAPPCLFTQSLKQYSFIPFKTAETV
jgi:hypothetical protein